MISQSDIRKISDQIARQFQPQRIILFGSYACGTPTGDSDVDLLIILPYRGDVMELEFEIRQALRPAFGMDILVRTPEEIARRIALNDFFIQEILDKGKTLYEASDRRSNRFFEGLCKSV